MTVAGDVAAHRDRRLAWAVGAVVGLLLVGPGLAPGAWLNLDLVVTDVTPVPRGVWGLGPELPRRVPFALPFAWVSAVWASPLPWKLAAVAAVASCAAGTWRLVARWSPTSGLPARAGAALVVAAGPFAATRLGAGHLGMTLALAALPWAVPHLLRPADRPARTVGWSLALAATGPFGGTLALPALACGLVASGALRAGRRASAARATVGSVLAQGVWLVPTLVVAAQGTDIASAGEFPTDLHGVGGPLRLLVGHGFWRPPSQVGRAQGLELVAVAILLVVGVVAGLRRIPRGVRAPAALVACLGLVVAAASGVEALEGAVAWIVDLPAGAALREGQRLLALWLVVAVPIAAIGVEAGVARVAERWQPLVGALPLAVGVVLVSPAMWGIGGALDPVELPPSWSEVRAQVRAEGGTVMALPWQAYPKPVVTGGRPVSQPLAIYLGGDVMTSSDPLFGDGSRERADPREPFGDEVAARMARGEPVGDRLVDLGVHWVVDIAVTDEPGPHLDPDDPALRPVLVEDGIALYEVVGWAPARHLDSGAPAAVDRPIAPVIRTTPDAVRVAAPGSTGWSRDGQGSEVDHGQLVLLPGNETGIYPSAAAVGLADAVAAALLVAIGWRWRARRRTSAPHDGASPADGPGTPVPGPASTGG